MLQIPRKWMASFERETVLYCLLRLNIVVSIECLLWTVNWYEMRSMQRRSWYCKCCCCNAWSFNPPVTGSAWLGWLLKREISMGHFGMVCSSGGHGWPIDESWHRELDVYFCSQSAAVTVVELACCFRCSSSCVLLYPLPICKSNRPCWSIVLCVSRHAFGIRSSGCASSTGSSLQHQSIWSFDTL